MLRTLFLLFFIFMVCRPVVKHWDRLFGMGDGTAGREVVLLLDCSASMNAKTGGVSAFARARQPLSPWSRGCGGRPGDARSGKLSSRRGVQPVQHRHQGYSREDRIAVPTSARANLFAALLQLFGPEAGVRRSNPALYLLTDCQSNTWKEARNQGLEKLLPEGTSLTVVNVGPRDNPENLAVVGDAPRRNRAIVGLPFMLSPRVVNYGKTETEVTLSVFIDEKEVARTPLTVKPGQAVVKPIVYTPSEPGLPAADLRSPARSPTRSPTTIASCSRWPFSRH